MGFLSLGSVAHFFLVFAVVVLVVLALVIAATPVEARVDDEAVVPLPRSALEPHVLRLLGSLPGVRFDESGPEKITVRTSYMPSWAVLVAIFGFPLGLLVLLVARRQLELYVRFLDEPDGRTRIAVVGRTRRRIARALGEAVDGLLAATTASASGVR